MRLLADDGWISGKRVVIDVTKLKSYTGWDMTDVVRLESTDSSPEGTVMTGILYLPADRVSTVRWNLIY